MEHAELLLGDGQMLASLAAPLSLGIHPEDRRLCVPVFRRVCPWQL